MIKLASAVVRDVHDIRAVFDRQARVFRGGNAFHDQRQLHALLHPDEIFPAQARLEFGIAETIAHGRAADDVAFAAPVVIAVHRHAQRAVAGGLRAVEYVPDPLMVAAHVELENQRFAHGSGGFLQTRQCRRADKRGRAARNGRTRHRYHALLRINKTNKAANGRHEYRQCEFFAEQCR